VLLGKHRSNQPNDGRLVGEDPHHLCPPFDLLVEALQRVVRPDLLPVLDREGSVGQHIFLGFVHQIGELCNAGPETVGYPPPLFVGAMGIGLSEDGAYGSPHYLLRVALGTKERAFLMKWGIQNLQGGGRWFKSSIAHSKEAAICR